MPIPDFQDIFDENNNILEEQLKRTPTDWQVLVLRNLNKLFYRLAGELEETRIQTVRLEALLQNKEPYQRAQRPLG